MNVVSALKSHFAAPNARVVEDGEFVFLDFRLSDREPGPFLMLHLEPIIEVSLQLQEIICAAYAKENDTIYYFVAVFNDYHSKLHALQNLE